MHFQAQRYFRLEDIVNVQATILDPVELSNMKNLANGNA